jgi:hypothetical protein
VFVFLSLVALQGAFLTLLSGRLYRRVSAVVQTALLVALLASLLVLSDFIVAVRGSQNPLHHLLFLPAWFTALYDRMLGDVPRHATSVSWEYALIGLVVVSALSAAAYLVSYYRYLRLCQEQLGASHRPGPWQALQTVIRKTVTHQPEAAAAFDFVIATVLRSARHRVVLGSCLGAGLALCLSAVFVFVARSEAGSLQRYSLTMLSIPAVLYFFLLGGTRLAFALPAELAANWIFRANEFQYAVFWRGVRAALWVIVLAPTALFGILLFASLWSFSHALQFSVLQAIAAVILMEWRFRDFQKVPFACSYFPGKANLKGRWPLYVLSFGCYIVLTGNLCLFLADRPLAYAASMLCGIWLIRHMVKRRDLLLNTSAPVFEEQSETGTITIFSNLPQHSPLIAGR